jgi:hypothetical protein
MMRMFNIQFSVTLACPPPIPLLSSNIPPSLFYFYAHSVNVRDQVSYSSKQAERTVILQARGSVFSLLRYSER